MTACHGYSDVMVNLLVNATNLSPPSQQYQEGEREGGRGDFLTPGKKIRVNSGV